MGGNFCQILELGGTTIKGRRVGSSLIFIGISFQAFRAVFSYSPSALKPLSIEVHRMGLNKRYSIGMLICVTKKHSQMFPLFQDEKNGMSAQWGKLASEILLQNWDAALEDFKRLREVIEGDVSLMSKRIN